MAGTRRRPAIIQNHATRTWAATARILHPGIGMADDADRDRMGAGLSELLEAASASSQIDVLAICVRTVPDDGTERAEWVRQHAGETEPELSAHIHAQLDASISGARGPHRSIRDGRCARGGHRQRTREGRVVVSAVEPASCTASLARWNRGYIGAIGCAQVSWLDSAELAMAIRTGFEPGDAPALADSVIHHGVRRHDRGGRPGRCGGPDQRARPPCGPTDTASGSRSPPRSCCHARGP